MSLASFRSLSRFDGGTANATAEEAINAAAEQGYAAVALSLDAIIHRGSVVADGLKKKNMQLIIEIHSSPSSYVNPELSSKNPTTSAATDVASQIQTFEHQLKQALTLTPVAIIASAGKDLWTLNEKLVFFGEASSRVAMLSPTTPVFFTTACGFALSHPWEAMRVLSHFPKLQVHLDLGQWCCAASSLPDDPAAAKHWSTLLNRVSSNLTSIVGAVGGEHSARVLHPADAVCARELRLHEHWWFICWQTALSPSNQQAGLSSSNQQVDQHIATPLFVEVEHPAAGAAMPFSKLPVVLPLEIARWSKHRLETLFQTTLTSKTSDSIVKLPQVANRKRSNVITDADLPRSNTVVNDNVVHEYAKYDVNFEDCTTPDGKVSALTSCVSALKHMVKRINNLEQESSLTMHAEWKQMEVDVSSVATQDVLDASNTNDDVPDKSAPGNFVIAVEGENDDIFRVAYVAKDDDSVIEIGRRLGMETQLLLSLNAHKYQGLRGGSKLIEGTWILLTPFQQREKTQARKRKKSIGSTGNPEVLWEAAIKTARNRLQLEAHEPANPDVFHMAVMLWDEREGMQSDGEDKNNTNTNANTNTDNDGAATPSDDATVNVNTNPDGDVGDVDGDVAVVVDVDGDVDEDDDEDVKKKKKPTRKKPTPKKKTTPKKSPTSRKRKQPVKTSKPMKKAKNEQGGNTDDDDAGKSAENHNDGNTNTNTNTNFTNNKDNDSDDNANKNKNTNSNTETNPNNDDDTNNDNDAEDHNDNNDNTNNIITDIQKEKEKVVESSSDDEEIPMYETENNDTLTTIAHLFDMDVKTILELNKKRFPGVKLNSRFRAGTYVFLPELNKSLPISE